MLNFQYSIADDGKGNPMVYPPFVTQQGLDDLQDRFVVRDDDVFIAPIQRREQIGCVKFCIC